jgi:hypothetical protein
MECRVNRRIGGGKEAEVYLFNTSRSSVGVINTKNIAFVTLDGIEQVVPL